MKYRLLFFLWVCLSFAHVQAEGLVLSESQQKSLKTHLQKTFGTSEYAFVKTLAVGDSGARMSVIRVGDKEYVLRQISPKRGVSNIVSEVVATEVASLLDIGVKIHFVDLENHLLLVDFIPPIKALPFEQPEKTTKEMAEFLKKISSLRINSKDQLFKSSIEKFSNWSFNEVPSHLRPVLKSILHGVEKAYGFTKNFSPVLSHNDLHTGNILVSEERAYIIDWESYSISNIYQELASVAYRVIVQPGDSNNLLALYFGREPTDFEKAQYYVASICYLFSLAVKELQRVPESQRLDISKEEFDSLAGFSGIEKKAFKGEIDLNDKTFLLYGWGILKTVYQLVKDKKFKKFTKFLKHNEKKERKSFSESIKIIKKKIGA